MIKKRIRTINGKGGQIWVETVIYTLIAFALIGLVLTFARPKIEEIQDKALIERSIGALEDIDLIISNIGSPGNQRVVGLGISKGALNIDGSNNKLFFEIESRYTYSEPGRDVFIGNILVRTEEAGRLNDITLTINYSDRFNITFNEMEETGIIRAAPTPYKILIANKGLDELNKTIIDLKIVN